jgi:hypothetical protein
MLQQARGVVAIVRWWLVLLLSGEQHETRRIEDDGGKGGEKEERFGRGRDEGRASKKGQRKKDEKRCSRPTKPLTYQSQSQSQRQRQSQRTGKGPGKGTDRNWPAREKVPAIVQVLSTVQYLVSSFSKLRCSGLPTVQTPRQRPVCQ